mmetsp:Transcript_16707/g.42798  ORF Transcript_16707/g.42798 Transcript_16707/m.42798 type:complete len:244 (+) Transcript_16707:1019-1750(+)
MKILWETTTMTMTTTTTTRKRKRKRKKGRDRLILSCVLIASSDASKRCKKQWTLIRRRWISSSRSSDADWSLPAASMPLFSYPCRNIRSLPHFPAFRWRRRCCNAVSASRTCRPSVRLSQTSILARRDRRKWTTRATSFSQACQLMLRSCTKTSSHPRCGRCGTASKASRNRAIYAPPMASSMDRSSSSVLIRRCLPPFTKDGCRVSPSSCAGASAECRGRRGCCGAWRANRVQARHDRRETL